MVKYLECEDCGGHAVAEQGTPGKKVCMDCIDQDGSPHRYVCSIEGCGNPALVRYDGYESYAGPKSPYRAILGVFSPIGRLTSGGSRARLLPVFRSANRPVPGTAREYMALQVKLKRGESVERALKRLKKVK